MTRMPEVETLHHVSLPVRDVDRARAFYRDVLGLREIARPPFSFAGAWFAAGDRQLHLIVHDRATHRDGKGVDSRDAHVALRVRSFRQALAHLRALGYREDGSAGELLRMKVSEQATAGWPQIHLIDPDHNVIEINAASGE